jgi:anti-sigma factor RsiW
MMNRLAIHPSSLKLIKQEVFMNKERDELNELKAVLRAMTEEAQATLGAHATLEELIAYHSGELPPEDVERLQEHLVWCRECLELLLDWAAWTESAQEGGRAVSEAQVAAAWQAMRAQLRAENLLPPVGWRHRLGAVFSRVSVPYAIAASLLIVSLALGAWIVSLRQADQQQLARFHQQLAERDQAVAAARGQLQQARDQLEETAQRAEQEVAELRQTVSALSQPQINVPMEDLQPRELLRGSQPGGYVQRIQVPSGASFFTLILNVVSQEAYPNYALEISDQQGRIVWRTDGLQKSRFNNFTIALARGLLPAGQYRLRLYGRRAGRKELVEEYVVRIQYQP